MRSHFVRQHFTSVFREQRLVFNQNPDVPERKDQVEQAQNPEAAANYDKMVADLNALKQKVELGRPDQEMHLEQKRELASKPSEGGDGKQEGLKKMQLKEFLKLDNNAQLTAVSNYNSGEVKKGYVFEFNFGENRKLEREVTAGHILPMDIQEITVEDGRQGKLTGKRQGNKGEFFTENGQRLKIYSGTKATVGEISSPEAVKERQEQTAQKVNEYMEKSSDKSEVVKSVVTVALEKGIDPKFFESLRDKDGTFKSFLSDADASYLDLDPQQQIEMAATIIARKQGEFQTLQRQKVDFTKTDQIPPKFLGFIMQSQDENRVRNTALELGMRGSPLKEAVDYSQREKILFRDLGVEVSPDYKAQLQKVSSETMGNRSRYEKVAIKTNMPWELIAAIHYRESSCNFGTYLHNGDPLGRPTVHVPKGKMFNSWEEAACDALTEGRSTIGQSANMEAIAHYAEAYNGMGYRNRGLNSPYVWAGTKNYERGHFVADGQFDANAVDKRPGIIPIVMALKNIDRQSMA